MRIPSFRKPSPPRGRHGEPGTAFWIVTAAGFAIGVCCHVERTRGELRLVGERRGAKYVRT